MGIGALIQLDFDPLLYLGELSFRWQAIGIAAAMLLGVGMAARGRAQLGLARPPRSAQTRSRFPPAPRVGPPAELIEAHPLRLDDMGLILLATVPGAVAGGRLLHGLAYWEAYSTNPEALLDPGLGSLSLLGAVLGGTLSGGYMARLLAAPVRRWADAAAIPLLVTLGLGKLAQLLGGSGQGLPFDGPWAVAFTGAGPWVSASPQLPSHPAQLYEGAWLLLTAILVLSLTSAVRHEPQRNGALFIVALAGFLLGRLTVGFTWRDQPVVGPLNAEQLMALATLLLLAVLGLAQGARQWRARKPRAAIHVAGERPRGS